MVGAFENGKGRFTPIPAFPLGEGREWAPTRDAPTGSGLRGREKMDSGLRRNDGLGVVR